MDMLVAFWPRERRAKNLYFIYPATAKYFPPIGPFSPVTLYWQFKHAQMHNGMVKHTSNPLLNKF